MESLFLKLANPAVTGGAVVLCLLLLRPLLRRAPKWITCLLWAAAAVRLVLPAALKTPIGLLRTSAPVTQYGDGGVWLVSRVPAVDWFSLGLQQRLFYSSAVSPDRISLVLEVLGVVWLLGTAALLGYALVSVLRLRRAVAESVPMAGERDVRLCDGIDTPFLLGLRRPVIYLPAALSEVDCRRVIAHERAHLRRRDHWWKALGYGLLALFWPNPLLWLGYSRFCRDLELACDEAVIRDLSAPERKAYAETLLRCSAPRSALAVPLAFGETGVKQRIVSLAKYRRPARWVTGLAAALCLLLGVCLATDYQPPAFHPDVATLDYTDFTPPVRVRDAETVSQLYDAFEAAKPEAAMYHAGGPIELGLWDERLQDGLRLLLYPDGTMQYYPLDNYAEQPVHAWDDGTLYRMVQELRQDAPDMADAAVSEVIRAAVLAGCTPAAGTEFRCETHDAYGVYRVRAGVWRVCVHHLVWDVAEVEPEPDAEPEQYRVLRAAQKLEVFELTRHADGGWTARAVPGALDDFASDLTNLRATKEEHTEGLVDACCGQIADRVFDLWLHFRLPDVPPWQEG